jgi:polysaccharide deacetylase
MIQTSAPPAPERGTRLLRMAVKGATLPLGAPGFRRPGDVVILLYHRVGEGGREVDLATEAFDRQVAHMAARDTVLSLDEAVGCLAGPARHGGIVVTFDDGYRDFYEHALPVLVRHGVPAVLYLATGLVREEAGRASGPGLLSWSELRQAVATGLVTIGAHTHTHPNLARVSGAEAEREMSRSKALIEDHLGSACRHFAYPFAVASPAAEEAARRLFDTAALGAWSTNRYGRTDRHRLGRTPVLRSDSSVWFKAKLGGLLDGEGLAYRVLRRGPWRESPVEPAARPGRSDR